MQIQSGGLPSGDSWTYAASGLPSGLSINTGSGQISGTITGSANTYAVSVTASDGQGRGQGRAHLERDHPVDNQSRDAERRSRRQRCAADSGEQLAQRGFVELCRHPLAFGLSISTSSGEISGTITGTANLYSVSVTASDGSGGSAGQSFTWNVSTLSVTNPGTQNGEDGDGVTHCRSTPAVCPAAIRGPMLPPACRRASPSTPAQARSAAPSLALGIPSRSRSRPATARAPRGPELHLERVQLVGDQSSDAERRGWRQHRAPGSRRSAERRSWTYAATGLPWASSINTSSGGISGTITGAANSYAVSVTRSDGQARAPARASPGTTTVGDRSRDQNGAVGDGVGVQIPSPAGLPSGDSWTYAATGLPSGVYSINTSSGKISGTITGTANTYSVSVTASDGSGTARARASPGTYPRCR